MRTEPPEADPPKRKRRLELCDDRSCRTWSEVGSRMLSPALASGLRLNVDLPRRWHLLPAERKRPDYLYYQEEYSRSASDRDFAVQMLPTGDLR